MKIENVEFEKQDNGAEVSISYTVSHGNNSDFTAVMADCWDCLELPDGTVFSGSHYCDPSVSIEPGGYHEILLGDRIQSTLVEGSQPLKMSASMAFYYEALTKSLIIPITDAGGSCFRSSDSFDFENKKHALDALVWVVPNGKAYNVEVVCSLRADRVLLENHVVLECDLLDSTGKCIQTSKPVTQTPLGGAFYWKSSEYGVTKKNIKDAKVRVSVKLLSKIPGSEAVITETITP